MRHEQALVLDPLEWPRLSRVELTNFWASEDELFHFVLRHGQLRVLYLQHTPFVSGSWKSLFSRVRYLPVQLDFCGEDTLLADNSPNYFLDIEFRRLLERFLTLKNFP